MNGGDKRKTDGLIILIVSLIGLRIIMMTHFLAYFGEYFSRVLTEKEKPMLKVYRTITCARLQDYMKYKNLGGTNLRNQEKHKYLLLSIFFYISSM